MWGSQFCMTTYCVIIAYASQFYLSVCVFVYLVWRLSPVCPAIAVRACLYVEPTTSLLHTLLSVHCSSHLWWLHLDLLYVINGRSDTFKFRKQRRVVVLAIGSVWPVFKLAACPYQDHLLVIVAHSFSELLQLHLEFISTLVHIVVTTLGMLLLLY